MRKLLFLLPLLILLTFPQYLYAQTPSSPSAVVSPTPVTVDYTMPYPGLLPDNPLYGLKVLRDRIISFFISNPLKRSSFDQLQADKRLEGAYYLQKKGSKFDDLVESTVSKAENYSESAALELKQAHAMGEDIGAESGTLHAAYLKHQQILGEMMQAASPTLKQSLQKESNRLTGLENMLHSLSNE